MKIGSGALLGAAVVLATIWSSAANATSAAYRKCMDAAKGNPDEMAVYWCNHDEEPRQDLVINALYKRAMAERTPTERQQLRYEERAWLKRRHDETEAVYAANRQSDYAGNATDTRWLQMTDDRIAELKAMLGKRRR